MRTAKLVFGASLDMLTALTLSTLTVWFFGAMLGVIRATLPAVHDAFAHWMLVGAFGAFALVAVIVAVLVPLHVRDGMRDIRRALIAEGR